jgi:hypothetical protein
MGEEPKNAEVVLIRASHVSNHAAVLVQANGKRQIIAVLQDGGAVMRRAIQDGLQSQTKKDRVRKAGLGLLG